MASSSRVKLTGAVAGVAVPRGANIKFSFTYTVDGRTFVDDNDGTGFYAPKPLPTHDPRKYVAAVKAATT